MAHRRSRAVGAALLAIGLSVGVVGCVEPFRGALIEMNLQAMPDSPEGSHYTLYFELDQAVVPVARFQVLDAVNRCNVLQALVPVGLQYVQAFKIGLDLEALCDDERRLGLVDKVDFATGSLVGGVRITTSVRLDDAVRAFVTVEPDGETDPAPSDRVVLVAELGDGRDPVLDAAREAVKADCEANPPEDADDPRCRPEAVDPVRTRRGVLLGTLVTAEPGFAAGGRITVVPAEDDALF